MGKVVLYVCSTSSKLLSIESLCGSSYQSFIITMPVCYPFRNITTYWSKNLHFRQTQGARGLPGTYGMKVGLKQEPQLSQRDRAMLHVIEYFTQGHSRSFEMTPLSRACVSPYWYSIVSMSVSRTVSEIFSVKWHDLENLGYGSFKVIENLVPLSR